MFLTGDDTMAAARQLGNIRFLIEQQLHLIDTLDRRGLDQRAALDLLRRYMQQDEELRRGMLQSQTSRVA